MLRKINYLTTVALLLMLSAGSALGQEKFSYGIKASYANTRFAIKELSEAASLKTSGRHSFIAGATVNYHFDEKFSLQSGLFLARKGGKFEISGDPFEEEPQEQFGDQFVKPADSFAKGSSIHLQGNRTLAARPERSSISAIPGTDEVSLVSVKAEASIVYLEIPLNLMYTISTGAGKIQLGAGPYYALGLSGKIRSEVTIRAEGDHTTITDEKVKFGSTADDDFRRHDFGLNFLAGFEFSNRISLNGGYGLGLSNIAAEQEGGSIKNKLFSVGLGYSFK